MFWKIINILKYIPFISCMIGMVCYFFYIVFQEYYISENYHEFKKYIKEEITDKKYARKLKLYYVNTKIGTISWIIFVTSLVLSGIGVAIFMIWGICNMIIDNGAYYLFSLVLSVILFIVVYILFKELPDRYIKFMRYKLFGNILFCIMALCVATFVISLLLLITNIIS